MPAFLQAMTQGDFCAPEAPSAVSCGSLELMHTPMMKEPKT